MPKLRGTKRLVKVTPATSTLKVSDQTVEELAELFKKLADRSRLKILLALAENGEMHVTALCELLDQSQPAVSHHLNLLRAHHLVGYRRDGKHNYYRVEGARVRAVLETFFSVAGNGHRQLQFDDFFLAFKTK